MLDVRFCYIFRYKMMFYLFHLRWIPNHFNFLKYSTLMLFFSYILYYIPRETFLFWFHISFRQFSDIFIPLELLERQGVLYELPEGDKSEECVRTSIPRSMLVFFLFFFCHVWNYHRFTSLSGIFIIFQCTI